MKMQSDSAGVVWGLRVWTSQTHSLPLEWHCMAQTFGARGVENLHDARSFSALPTAPRLFSWGKPALIAFSPSHIVPPPSDSTPNIHRLPKTLAFTFFTTTEDNALTFKHFCSLYLLNCLNTYKYDFRSHFLAFNSDELSVTSQGSQQELL